MSFQFVDGWTIAQILGEGAFGEVKLLVNDDTNEAIAVKTINTIEHPEAQLAVRKEVVIHKSLTHPYIIRYFGQRSEPGIEYIFLEYAAGGELFDKIEPDFGMKSKDAQRYIVQLVSAVQYLHDRGVTHRDIKPENILLSDRNDVKLSDFGMATMFRKNGIERLLDKRCGTMPYVAPEVLMKPYSAIPADMWSCGIVLVALLAGELPWDVPSPECPEYSSWNDNIVTISPWNKLDTVVLSLLRKLLSPNPHKRPAPSDFLEHRWCKAVDLTDPVRRPALGTTPKRQNSKIERSLADMEDVLQPISATQPLPQSKISSSQLDNDSPDANFSFSQPVMLDDMLLSSQLNCTQVANLNLYQRLVRRMTRFFVSIDADSAAEKITIILEAFGCVCRRGPSSVITASSTDRRKMLLVFKVTMIDMSGNLLLDFRLSKGDGLEFKKMFLKLKESLRDVIAKAGVMP